MKLLKLMSARTLFRASSDAGRKATAANASPNNSATNAAGTLRFQAVLPTLIDSTYASARYSVYARTCGCPASAHIATLSAAMHSQRAVTPPCNRAKDHMTHGVHAAG